MGSVSSTLILMLFASFFKKSSTLSSFGVLISAGIGFVIGAYIPVSQFDESMQTVLNLIPGSQIAGLLRNILVTPSLNQANDALNGIDNGLFAEGITEIFALKLNIFGESVSINFMIIYSLIAIAVFLVLNLISFKVSSKRKS
ncbi:MAG: hypothetical protein U0M12_04380 [Acutalibacteraceae bacterium]|nr:hypothetical protein [Acutalibacteraceae bacterium]